jgi:phenylalanyl-tRNA synthetase alpha chain
MDNLEELAELAARSDRRGRGRGGARAVRVDYLGKKGALTACSRACRRCPRRSARRRRPINVVKQELQALIGERRRRWRRPP